MQIVPFSFAAEPGYGLPPATLENLYVQETQSGPVSYAGLPRPGLDLLRTVGSGPTRGKFQKAGVFSGADFTVSGTTLYRNSTSLGTVAGTGRVYFAASAEQLVVVGGGNAYCYDGSTLTQITDEDLPENVGCVAYKDGRFIYTDADSDRFYWSAINDATSIDGLDFASAEGSPDPLLGVLTLGDEVVFFGTGTVQFFYSTGVSDAPFQPVQNRSYDQTGCATMASVVAMDNNLFFVGDDRVVYRAGNSPERISDHALETALRACEDIDDLTAFSVPWDGHKFLVVNVPGEGTWAWDAANAGRLPSAWARWSTFGRTTFRCNSASVSEGSVTLGDDTSGDQFTLSTSYSDGDILIRRKASAWIPNPEGIQVLGPIILRGAVGVGLDVGPDPICQMRLSRDRGNTFTDWRDGSLGTAPNYITPAKWHRNGRIFPPGLLIEFQCTEALLTAWWGVTVNEPV